MSDAELEAFEDALGELGERVSEFLAEETNQTPEKIDTSIDDYSMPDPLEDKPANDN
jgi:hypothetical protein